MLGEHLIKIYDWLLLLFDGKNGRKDLFSRLGK
jgi:hypothetical protein